MATEIQNLDKYINRLISGVVYLTHKGRLYEVRPASVCLKQKAAIYYDMLVETYKYQGVQTEKKFLDFCVKKGLLAPDYKELMKKDRDSIDNLKMALFQAGPRITVADNIRKQLKKRRKEQDAFLNHYYDLKHNTLEGIAEHARKTYIFLNSIYDENGNAIFSSSIYEDKEIDVSLYNFFTAVYTRELIGEKTIRTIARSSNWRLLWNTKKHNVFYNDYNELNEEQRLIVTYSELYDFAFQHDKTPPQTVIEDDDVFDGWYLTQLKKYEAEKAGKDIDKFGKFNPAHSEIFIVAQDQEEADSIYASNSPESQKILRARAEILKTKGVAKDVDLPDVQHDLRIQAAELLRQNMGGKNNGLHK